MFIGVAHYHVLDGHDFTESGDPAFRLRVGNGWKMKSWNPQV
jgi:hypothetical protein